VASQVVDRFFDASPAAIYRVLTDRQAVGLWRAPDGMTCTVHTFDVRQGGEFRISLTYDDESRAGKSLGNVDTYHGFFRELVPDRRIVEVVEFETSDPELEGEMTITTSLEAQGGRTKVVVAFEGLPEGVSLDDNATGTATSLSKLAKLVERSHDFDAIYAAGTPPWDIGRPQPAFDRLAAAGDLVGRVLDVGCGTGEHALMAASLGYEAVGVDLSVRAIELANTKATERGLDVRFVVADALRLVDLGERFDTVLDCGLFHVLDDDERRRYVGSLAEVVPPAGRYHMLCFSDRQPGDWGPRRVTQEEIRVAFSVGWDVESIESAVIALTFDPAGALAWQLAATRK
jgi:uncharacterized protein YndB with AHSA1/START domain